jgi:transcriptional regulator with XRE-family HTH domain
LFAHDLFGKPLRTFPDHALASRVKTMTDARRIEFSDFLRSRREKLNPVAFGLASGRRRRTAGLRREEVAELAGIGVDWYIRLEQGRTVNPSVTTIDALARALRLNKTDRAHLQALARYADRRAFSIEAVPETIQRLLDSLDQPAYVTGRRWDLPAWNKVAEEVFAFSRLPDQDRNILLCMRPIPARENCLARAGPTKPNAW